MHRLVCGLAVFLISMGALWGQVITNDPNAAGAPALKRDTATDVDGRLSQMVSYDGGYLRLHSVVDALSEKTGVAIYSGSGRGDWRVRDIPLTVCVNNVSLGQLMNALADASHVQLAASKIESGKSTFSYRFIRTSKGEAEINAPLEAQKKAGRVMAEWAWDALADLHSKLPAQKDGEDTDVTEARLVGEMLESLGSEARNKILNGEPLTVKAVSLISPQMSKSLAVYASKSIAATWDDISNPLVPTEDELSNVTLSIKLFKPSIERPGEELVVALARVPVDRPSWKKTESGYRMDETERMRQPFDWSVHPISMAKKLLAKGAAIPPAPDLSKILEVTDPLPGPGFKALVTDDDWKPAVMQKEVELDLPRDKRFITPSEVMSALAKATGLNIVSEDFASHSFRYKLASNRGLQNKMTVRDILSKLDECRMEKDKIQWFFNEEDNLLVGWSKDWRQHHLNLAPEATINGMLEKVRGPGADLDDLTPMFSLTDSQFLEWVFVMPEFAERMFNMRTEEQVIWMLYDSLSPQEKAMAKSESGFALAKFSPDWLRDLLAKTKKINDESILPTATLDDYPPEMQQRLTVYSDPETLSRMVMRIKREPRDCWLVHNTGDFGLPNEVYYPKGNGLVKYCYSIELTGKVNGQDISAVSRWEFMPFPVYTPEKETELRRLAEERSKK